MNRVASSSGTSLSSARYIVFVKWCAEIECIFFLSCLLGHRRLRVRSRRRSPQDRRGFRTERRAVAVRRRLGRRRGFGDGARPGPSPPSHTKHERFAHQVEMFLLGEDERTAVSEAHRKVTELISNQALCSFALGSESKFVRADSLKFARKCDTKSYLERDSSLSF